MAASKEKIDWSMQHAASRLVDEAIQAIACDAEITSLTIVPTYRTFVGQASQREMTLIDKFAIAVLGKTGRSAVGEGRSLIEALTAAVIALGVVEAEDVAEARAAEVAKGEAAE